MLEAALDEHPNVPGDPEGAPGRRRRQQASALPGFPPGPRHAVTLLAETCTRRRYSRRRARSTWSPRRWDSRRWSGSPVRTFGMPFYAGWGLTQDELPAPPRRGAARGVTLPTWCTPRSSSTRATWTRRPAGAAKEVERVLDWMGLQRRQRERFAPRIQVVAFSTWEAFHCPAIPRRQQPALQRHAARARRRRGARGGAGPPMAARR